MSGATVAARASTRIVRSKAYRDVVRATPGLVDYWRMSDPAPVQGNVFTNEGPGPDQLRVTGGGQQSAPSLLPVEAGAANSAFKTTVNNGAAVAGSSPAYTSITSDPGSGNIAWSFEMWIAFTVNTTNAFAMMEGSSANNNPFAGLAIPNATGFGGRMSMYVRNNNGGQTTVNGPNAINDGQPHHVVGSQSNTLLSLYVDGQLVNTNNVDRQVRTTDRLGVGTLYRAAVGLGLIGTYDEIATYSRALTAAEVASHNSAGRS